MLPVDRPDHEVGWPRAVQTGIAILGACAFGAVALSYGYGFGGGGRTESYPQAGIPTYDSTAVLVVSSNFATTTSADTSLGVRQDTAHSSAPWDGSSNGINPYSGQQVSTCEDSTGVVLPAYMVGMRCLFHDLGRISKLRMNNAAIPNALWDAPEVGDTIAYRVFNQLGPGTATATVPGADHGWQSDLSIGWSWRRDGTAGCGAGEYKQQWFTTDDNTYNLCLDQDTLYMFEWRAIVTDSDSINYDLCISSAHDPATHVASAFDGCRYSDIDFTCDAAQSTSCSNGDTLQVDKKFYTANLSENINGMEMGQTQPNSEPCMGEGNAACQGFQLWTGLAVATTDNGGIGTTGWIGPFIPCRNEPTTYLCGS